MLLDDALEEIAVEIDGVIFPLATIRFGSELPDRIERYKGNAGRRVRWITPENVMLVRPNGSWRSLEFHHRVRVKFKDGRWLTIHNGWCILNFPPEESW